MITLRNRFPVGPMDLGDSTDSDARPFSLDDMVGDFDIPVGMSLQYKAAHCAMVLPMDFRMTLKPHRRKCEDGE